MPSSSLSGELQRRAFGVILDQCLKARADETILVIYDEGFAPYHDALNEALRQRQMFATQISMPLSCQLSLIARASQGSTNPEPALPPATSAAIDASTVILCFLGAHPRTLPVRRAILDHPRSVRSRLGHIPGLTDDVLEVLTRSPIAEILEASEIVAWALGESNRAELLTAAPGRDDCRLEIKLDGWDNEPFMSPGVVFPGGWGNALPGETFCCPDPLGVNGKVCINGSVPHAAVRSGEEIILTFEQGKLVRWDGHPGSPPFEFFERERAQAAQRGDREWNTFAELGIGLNPAVGHITGSQYFDEKALHTVHVAIGDNSVFGHNIRAAIHADLVCRAPTFRLNDQALLLAGKLNLKPFSSRRDCLVRVDENLPSGAVVFPRDGRVFLRDGLLMRRVLRGSRVSLVRMGNTTVAQSLAELLEELRTFGEVPWEDFQSKCPKFGTYDTSDLLNILYHYRALGIASVK